PAAGPDDLVGGGAELMLAGMAGDPVAVGGRPDVGLAVADVLGAELRHPLMPIPGALVLGERPEEGKPADLRQPVPVGQRSQVRTAWAADAAAKTRLPQ